MTQTPLTAYELGESNSNDTNDSDTNDENNSDDESKRQIEAIVAGGKDEFDTMLNDTLDAIGINPKANPELDKIPEYEPLVGTLKPVPELPDDPIEITGPNGTSVKIHTFLFTFGALYDPFMDDISDIIADAAANDTTDLVVRDVKYLGRDTDKIAEHVEALLESGTNIHTDTVTLDLDPKHGETAADLVRAIGAVGPGIIPIPDTDELVNDDNAVGGRPPLGFEYNTDGELTTTDDYAKICRELSKAAKEEQSKRATAKEIGCAPRTVKRAIEDHPERYQL